MLADQVLRDVGLIASLGRSVLVLALHDMQRLLRVCRDTLTKVSRVARCKEDDRRWQLQRLKAGERKVFFFMCFANDASQASGLEVIAQTTQADTASSGSYSDGISFPQRTSSQMMS